MITTKNAPEAIGSYSIAGDLAFISGCCPFSEKDDSVIGVDIKEQTTQAVKNLSTVVEASGRGMTDVAKTIDS